MRKIIKFGDESFKYEFVKDILWIRMLFALIDLESCKWAIDIFHPPHSDINPVWDRLGVNWIC